MSFGAWRVVALKKRRFELAEIAEILATAGYVRILSEDTLQRWAVLSRGEKPHAEDATTLERVKIGAEDKQATTSRILRGNELLSLRTHYLHLLVRQIPNKPVWTLQPDEKIEWSAVALAESQTLLTFTSLPKAVEFMQTAVLAGLIKDISKMPKFSRQTAAGWDVPVWVNPTLDDIQDNIIWHEVDPATAEASDE